MGKRGKSINGEELASPEALAAYFAAQLAASRVSSKVDEAQDLMFDAWDCEDPKKRVMLARAALKISADCADAYVLLAQETADTADEAIVLFGQGVAAGERALGPAAFKDDVGMFWGLLETRPYMRARQGLALALWDAGRADDAVKHGQEMLRLNPNDNQGIRYLVAGWLQLLARDEEVGVLLSQYKGDISAEWAWITALAAFRKHGDRPVARKALLRAIEVNPYVAPYLLKLKRLPRGFPAYVEMGGKDEAAAYVRHAGAAWRQPSSALGWLADTLSPPRST